jgi:hypothetical protein
MGYKTGANLDDLVGKTVTAIDGARVDGDEIVFTCSDGSEYLMYHDQDCCESVDINDIVGDISDLIGSPIVRATEDSNSGDGNDDDSDGTFTWTFYNIATAKGHVTIKWYGSSNGYYSESVDFILRRKADNE